VSGWTAIVPVKRWALAKSRLARDEDMRGRLARAFALDVLHELGRSAQVEAIVIVSAEAGLAPIAWRLGATVIVDRPLRSGNGLNLAIDAGRHWALARRPGDPVVVVPTDLPAMSAETLDNFLGSLGRRPRCFVPDAAGTGTTLLCAERPGDLDPAYGIGSALAHEARGHVARPDADARLRRDVDTVDDLAQARLLGLREESARVRPAPGHCPPTLWRRLSQSVPG
jgi:2-phospho-L-lactate guanylyltransferase